MTKEELKNQITDLEKSCDETQGLLDKQIEATYKLSKENEELKILLKQCYKYHLHPEVFEYPYDDVEKFFNEEGLC